MFATNIYLVPQYFKAKVNTIWIGVVVSCMISMCFCVNRFYKDEAEDLYDSKSDF